jgi:hypothetical protein
MSSFRSGTPPSGTALAVSDQTGQAVGFISVQPLVNRIRLAFLQETVLGDPMRRVPFGDLEDRAAPLSKIRLLAVFEMFDQLLSLRRVEGERSEDTHQRLLSFKDSLIYPSRSLLTLYLF